MSGWLVAKVNVQREEKVSARVARLGWLAFTPRYLTREGERHLYPGYSFVHVSCGWHDLLEVDGVFGVVASRSTNEPWTSEGLDKAVERLIRSADSFGHVPAPELDQRPRFHRGMRVRAVSGVFAGCCGLFDILGRDGRARVTLDLFSGAAVSMRESDLAPDGAPLTDAPRREAGQRLQ